MFREALIVEKFMSLQRENKINTRKKVEERRKRNKRCKTNTK